MGRPPPRHPKNACRSITIRRYDRCSPQLTTLADRLADRFAVSEMAEIIRQTSVPQIRAITYETLAMMQVRAILPLLDDPLYAGIAANALELKAFEFESEEARDVLDQFDAENTSDNG